MIPQQSGGGALGPNLTNGDTVRQFPVESDHVAVRRDRLGERQEVRPAGSGLGPHAGLRPAAHPRADPGHRRVRAEPLMSSALTLAVTWSPFIRGIIVVLIGVGRAVRQRLPAAAHQPRRPPRLPRGDGRAVRVAGPDGRGVGRVRHRAEGQGPVLEAGRRHQRSRRPWPPTPSSAATGSCSRPSTHSAGGWRDAGRGRSRAGPGRRRVRRHPPEPGPGLQGRRVHHGRRVRQGRRALPDDRQLRPLRLLPPAALRPRPGAAGRQAEHRAGQGAADTGGRHQPAAPLRADGARPRQPPSPGGADLHRLHRSSSSCCVWMLHRREKLVAANRSATTGEALEPVGSGV